MKKVAPLSLALLAVAAVLAVRAIPSAHADTIAPVDALRCGVIDLDRVLRESLPANRIRDKLQREFAPVDAKIVEQMDPYNARQRQWLDARKAGDEESARRLRKELDEMAASIEEARQKFRNALGMRQNQEMGPLLKSIESAYVALGERDGFDMLFQRSEARPVWTQPGLPRLECATRTDLTTPLIHELDVAARDR